jgi:cation-transporting ATPase 13A3/4/5
MTPNESFKITENLIFSPNAHTLKNRRYKLTIKKRFEFSSKFQANSVIVKNHLDGSYRFFIKGAPEKIIQFCISETLPDSLSEQLLNHTQTGYRVLACATKPIPERDDYESEEEREKYECDLIFLGLVVFRNKLKRDTKHIISKLKGSSINLVMATGDNPFTSISVARECGLIDRNKEIFFCNLSKENSEECLELYNIKMGNRSNKAPGIASMNIANEDLVNRFKHSLKKRGIFVDYERFNHSFG